MNNYLQFLLVLFLGLSLVSCGGGQNPTTVVKREPASAINGQIYYQHNCGGCHSAGQDTTNIFGAVGLSQAQDKIKSDMSEYGGFYKLMGRFTDIPQRRVDELKAYFETL